MKFAQIKSSDIEWTLWKHSKHNFEILVSRCTCHAVLVRWLSDDWSNPIEWKTLYSLCELRLTGLTQHGDWRGQLVQSEMSFCRLWLEAVVTSSTVVPIPTSPSLPLWPLTLTRHHWFLVGPFFVNRWEGVMLWNSDQQFMNYKDQPVGHQLVCLKVA